jgi:hypothetical protein
VFPEMHWRAEWICKRLQRWELTFKENFFFSL